MSPRQPRRRGQALDQSVVESEGGLVVLDEGGQPLFVAPAAVTEPLRYFVSRVQNATESGFPRSLALTSALAEEGVSFVARNLAAVLAHDLQQSVCLVETHWWKRRATTDEQRPGLAEVLLGEVDLGDVLVTTSDPRLRILRSGHPTGRDRSALARGDAMTDLAKLLAKQFDIVVFDVPPVLRVSEAIELSRRAEAVALVVRHGVTTDRHVTAALDNLGNANVLGVILNRSRTHIPRALRRFADLS